ncbi:MAG: DNA polymerase III subunit beta [Candidatus Alcyoniella australis]|nr:DNA polymerase III subunit beta [Candidatus Alcyoniella australis]
MEFTITKDDFLRGLGRIQSIIDKKHTLPILSNVLLEAGKDQLELVATDLEVGIRVQLSADVADEGNITVSAKKLFEIIRELPEGPIRIATLDNDWIQVTSGKAVFKVVGLAAEDFPMFPAFDPESFEAVDGDMLLDMMEKTAFAASTDETRYYLNGVLFESEQGEGQPLLRMVSTDGHRLCMVVKTVESLGNLKLEEPVIIPRKGVAELRKLLSDDDEPVMLMLRERNIIVSKGSVLFVIRLIDGEFPDYRQVVPKELQRSISTDRGLLSSALRRVSVLSSEITRGVKLDFEGNALNISSSNPNFGDATEELDVASEGEPLAIGFNSRYLLDVLGASDAEEVKLSLGDELSPAIIRFTGNEEFLAVIMPMRL